jgi:hypothetical protein
MRLVFRVLWSLWLLAFTMLIAAAQVGPDDAVANLAKWARKFGVAAPPPWLTNPSADRWAAMVGACGVLIGVGALVRLRAG